MKKNIFFALLLILTFAGISKISAQQSANSVAGTWKVSDVIIADNDTSKPSGLQKENSFLGYMMIRNIPVEFKENGTVELRKENSRFTWKYELNGAEIKFTCVESNYGQAGVDGKNLSRDLVTYTVYKIEKTGKQLIISRKNTLMSETYILEQ